jgi:putative hydrolase of the HAD superfamily
MPEITTVIFDMFNTLVHDGEEYWYASFERIVREQRLEISATKLREEWSSGDRNFRDGRTREGAPFQTYTDAWQKSFSRVFSSLQLPGDAAGAVRIVLEDMGQRPIHPEALEALAAIQGSWRIALLSNADDGFLKPVVARMGFPFEAVLSSEGACCYKPRPGLFQEMIRRLGITPEEAVYVGDRQYEDVQGAVLAGMRAVWINRNNTALDPGLPAPHHEVKSLLEIPRIIGPQALSKDRRI